MKRIRLISFIILLVPALFASKAFAAHGDPMLVKILISSYGSAGGYRLAKSDSGEAISPLKTAGAEEYGDDYALYTFALDEGTVYSFSFIPNNPITSTENPAADTFIFTADPAKPEYLCSVDAVTFKPFTISSATATPTPSPTSTSGASSGASEKVTVKSSDFNALVIADDGSAAPSGDPGETVSINLSLTVNREYLPTEQYTLRNITIAPNIPERRRGDSENIADWPFDVDKASYLRHIGDLSNGANADVTFEFRISQSAEAGTYPVSFALSATVWRYDSTNGTSITEGVEFTLTQYVNVRSDGALVELDDPANAIGLAAAWDGDPIPAPRGKGGEAITVSLPLTANAALTDITIEPIFSADADECPVIYEAINYTKELPDLENGESALVEYDFKLLPDDDGGNKPLSFKVKYQSGGARGECVLTAFLYVEPTSPKSADAEQAAKSQADTPPPVITLESYDLQNGDTPLRELYAGEAASISFKLRNNSASHAKNLRLTVAPGDALAFDPGESGARFIESIAPGSVASVVFGISANADALPGRHEIEILLEYESEDGAAANYAHVVEIPLIQRVRVVTEPAIVNGGNPAVAGVPCTVRLRLLNLGMAGVRNVRASVEGEGLSTYESYFNKVLVASESASVELRILSDVGEHSGRVVVTCESSDGVTHELVEEINFLTIAASEASDKSSAQNDNSASNQSAAPTTNDALKTAVIASASALAVALFALGYVYFKIRHRRKIKKMKRRSSSVSLTLCVIFALCAMFAPTAAAASSTVTLTFTPGEGDGVAFSELAARASNITLPPNAFAKSGHIFAGWYHTTRGMTYKAASTYSTGTSSAVLEAQWLDNTIGDCTLSALQDSLLGITTANAADYRPQVEAIQAPLKRLITPQNVNAARSVLAGMGALRIAAFSLTTSVAGTAGVSASAENLAFSSTAAGQAVTLRIDSAAATGLKAIPAAYQNYALIPLEISLYAGAARASSAAVPVAVRLAQPNALANASDYKALVYPASGGAPSVAEPDSSGAIELILLDFGHVYLVGLSPTPIVTPTPSPTPTTSPAPTASSSPTPTASSTPSPSPTATLTPTNSPTPTASTTPAPTYSPAPTASPTPTASTSPSPKPMVSPSATPPNLREILNGMSQSGGTATSESYTSGTTPTPTPKPTKSPSPGSSATITAQTGALAETFAKLGEGYGLQRIENAYASLTFDVGETPKQRLRLVKYDNLKERFAALPSNLWRLSGQSVITAKLPPGVYGIVEK